MSAEHYIKTLCPLCDGSIEFPAHAFGEMVNCPHCQVLIELGKPSEPPIKLTPLPTDDGYWVGGLASKPPVELPPLPKPPAEPFPFHWVLGWIRWEIARKA